MSENKLCVIDCRPEVCNSNVICTLLVVLCHTRCKKTKYYARKTSFDIKNDVENYYNTLFSNPGGSFGAAS